MSKQVRADGPSSVQPLNRDRLDPLTRLDETTDALALLRDALIAEEPLRNALQRLADTAARAIPDADAVSVSVMTTTTRPCTAAATDNRFVDVDEAQYSANRGPCLESAHTLQAVRAVVGQHLDAWPEFEAAAAEQGIRAYLAIPVVLPGSDQAEAQHVGSLNVYSFAAEAFDPFDEGLMRLFTTAASAAISSSHRWQRSREHIHHLEQALISRAVIEQAKGVLMAVHTCTAEEAFAMLVERSQHENIKLRDVAKNLIESATRACGPE